MFESTKKLCVICHMPATLGFTFVAANGRRVDVILCDRCACRSDSLDKIAEIVAGANGLWN